MATDPDATVRLNGAAASGPNARRPRSPLVTPAPAGARGGLPGAGEARGGMARLVAAAAAAGLAVGAAALWFGWRDPAPAVSPTEAPARAQGTPLPAPPEAGAPPALPRIAVLSPPPLPVPADPTAEPRPPLLDEAAILAHRAVAPTLLQLASNPRVFVLDFPDLASQGAALNRVAALIEKAGLPRDRLLTDVELVAAIARSRETPETWYYGHDYRGTDLARFFALAERDGIALNPLETWVRAQLARALRFAPEGGEIALISVAAPGPRLTEAMRAAILRHEIGHGHYFTLPAYAAHVRRVWREAFTEAERAAFRRFLGAEGYDTSDEDLMMNEAQAYLIHTPDPQFFSAAHLGLPDAQVERMRELMRAGAPLPR